MKGKVPKPRDIIKKFLPYVPGRSIEEIKEEYGAGEIIKLASNENLWGASQEAITAARQELKNINFYPRSEPILLKKALASKLNVSVNSIIFGNGTDEIIELIAKTFLNANDNIIISENSFIRFKMSGNLMGVKVQEVPQDNFTINLKGIFDAIDEKTKLIFIDNPCNPTGTFVEKEALADFISKIAANFSQNPPLVVIDEAYFEYVNSDKYSTALDFRNTNGSGHSAIPLMILRTFSKIYGLAGLRIGYGISSEEIISLLNRIRPPFNTNRIAQAAALGALKEEKFHKDIAQRTEIEKKYLYDEFQKLNIECIPSATNFILVKFGQNKVKKLCEFILQKRIILRPLAGYNLKDYIRITIGKREHNMKLIRGIKDFFKKDNG